MTRSTASSRARLSMSCALLRAVRSAASLRTFARSAPVKPGVLRARTSRLTLAESGLPFPCTSRILLAALETGSVDADLTVEATGTQECGVEHVGAVGRRDEDDVGLDVKAVHLDQELVEGLLAFVVAAADAGAAVAADGIDLVDEDDGRAVLLGLLEEVADAARAHADEHLDEVGTGDREEGHSGLAGDGSGQQGLAGAGRAVQQHALRDAGADGLELGRLLEEVLDLFELLDGLVGTGDVAERDLRGPPCCSASRGTCRTA